MKISRGSEVAFAPGTYRNGIIEFRIVHKRNAAPTDEPAWTLPMVGWAVVVTYVDDESADTCVYPVVVDTDDGGFAHLQNTYEYAHNRSDGDTICVWRFA